MKIGVVQFPGSNCDRETKLALERVGFTPVDCFWTAAPDFVASLDGFIIVGGFSYEDRVRSGLIASRDPFMQVLAKEAAKGKPILGICNGAQILVESGLMGGPIALTHNQRVKDGKVLGTGFYNDWVEIQSTQASTDQPIRLPIAHAEGRFVLTEEFYQALKAAGALMYTYCGDNPNGSMHKLAAVSNAAGNVMAMMPHPERTPAGDVILKSFFASVIPAKAGIQQSKAGRLDPRLRGDDKSIRFTPYFLNPNASHYWVALKIHDNEAISLENTLQQMGVVVKLKKLIHWELDGPLTAEMFNPEKEYLTEPKGQYCYVVRAKTEDAVKRDVVWCSDVPLTPYASLLANPLTHDIFMLPQAQGKVRDIYDEGDTLLLVATNRLSAFDRAICEIPQKGEVLNQLSAWWFKQTAHIIQNHVVELPSSNATRVKKCKVLPIEVIVRGYLTGSTNTSIWTLYQQGQRDFFGTVLPDGLTKNTKLPKPIVTPTTKDKDHDRPLERKDLENMPLWPQIEKTAIALFQFGSELLAQKGLILVDTKYEFGLDEKGQLTLIDEIHTPDSSRIWDEGTLEAYDKEIIRLWVRERCDPYHQEVPPIPQELIDKVSRRYQELFQKVTGETL